jgi:hypothetical protein
LGYAVPVVANWPDPEETDIDEADAALTVRLAEPVLEVTESVAVSVLEPAA